MHARARRTATRSFPDDRLERILTAVSTIERSLGILARKQRVDREAYKRDRETRDVVERRFVKMTEAAIDVGEEVLKVEWGRPARSNPGTMRELATVGALPAETADAMAQAARFRNVLAHTYGDAIDDDAVYDALLDLDRYGTFVHEIRNYLDDVGALEE